MDNLYNSNDFVFFKKLIREAGELAKKIQGSGVEVSRKSDATIVTQADLAVQKFIIDGISDRYDNFNFIYEEEFSGAARAIDNDTISIIIDPIDGTAMFSMYLPIWCVSIGVFKGHDPLYGFVYSPGFGMLFHNDDQHAYCNDEERAIIKEARIDSESNFFYASEVRNTFTIDFPGKVRNIGSTALHACLLVDNARNRTIAFIGKSNLWDWAGAIPIILKAGGNLKFINGSDLDCRYIMENNFAIPDYLVAYSTENFEVIRKIIKRNKGG